MNRIALYAVQQSSVRIEVLRIFATKVKFDLDPVRIFDKYLVDTKFRNFPVIWTEIIRSRPSNPVQII